MQQSLYPRKGKMHWQHPSIKQQRVGSVSSTNLCTLPTAGWPHFTSFHLPLPLLRSGTWGPEDLHHLSVAGTALSYGRCSSLPGTYGIPAPRWGQLPERPGLEAKWGQIISATGGGTWKGHPIHTRNSGLKETCCPCDTFFFLQAVLWKIEKLLLTTTVSSGFVSSFLSVWFVDPFVLRKFLATYLFVLKNKIQGAVQLSKYNSPLVWILYMNWPSHKTLEIFLFLFDLLANFLCIFCVLLHRV